ncbi:hypothetical protein NBRC116592_03990 [Colwellia sp. KU-HH00111]|uniref:hypothetical protein n=1 Tax=Colwellia sp. KU-HH00111 TaxID=3127652 RepID=UPI0031054692
MSFKLQRIDVTATDRSAKSFEINSVEQLSECVNNQHNLSNLFGFLYFDNNEKIVMDNKADALSKLEYLHFSKVIHLNLYAAH